MLFPLFVLFLERLCFLILTHRGKRIKSAFKIRNKISYLLFISLIFIPLFVKHTKFILNLSDLS